MLDSNLWNFQKVALRPMDSALTPGTQSLVSAKQPVSPTF